MKKFLPAGKPKQTLPHKTAENKIAFIQTRLEFSLNVSLKESEHITKTALKNTVSFTFREP